MIYRPFVLKGDYSLKTEHTTVRTAVRTTVVTTVRTTVRTFNAKKFRPRITPSKILLSPMKKTE